MSEEDLELLITLDNPGIIAEEEDTFNHFQAESTVAYWPGQPFPTRRRSASEQKSLLIIAPLSSVGDKLGSSAEHSSVI